MSKEIERLIEDETSLRKFYKKVLTIVSISQIFGGAGLAAGITVGALIAKDILGTDAYSGLPSALLTLGSAGAAMMVGALSQKFGRRIGLAIGIVSGGVGAIGVIFAAVLNNRWLLFIALLIYGSVTATYLQARNAGTDLAMVYQRSKAISIYMVMSTFVAVIGPTVADFMGHIVLGINLPPRSGPFIVALFAYILAGLV